MVPTSDSSQPCQSIRSSGARDLQKSVPGVSSTAVDWREVWDRGMEGVLLEGVKG